MPFLRAAHLRVMAGSAPDNLRILFASMAREAGRLEDEYARTSYLEGWLGLSPNSLVNSPRKVRDARAAFQGMSDANPILIQLRAAGVQEADIAKLLGDRDLQLFESLMTSVRDGLKQESVRGYDARDVAMSLIEGVSPLTAKPLGKFGGGGIFWAAGKARSGKPFTLGSIVKVVGKMGWQAAMDLRRGTTGEELGQKSLTSPLDSDSMLTLQDTLVGDSAVGRSDYVEIVNSIFSSPQILNPVNRLVQQQLRSPTEKAVWDVVSQNPHLILVKNQGEVALNNNDVAQQLSEAGVDISPQRVGQLWHRSVWPALTSAFGDSGVATSLLRNHHILEILDEAAHRRVATPVKPSSIPNVMATRVARRWAARVK